MFCKNCGAKLPENHKFCQYCGTSVGETNTETSIETSNNINTTPQQTTQPQQPAQKPKKKTNVLLIVILSLVGFFVAFIILIVVIGILTFRIIESDSPNTNKLVCEADEGTITIKYNDDGIIGYTAYGFKYDLEEQKQYAKKIGMNKYTEEFNENFQRDTTNGKCSINGEEMKQANNTTPSNSEEKEKPTNKKIVGDNDYGYITVPSNWAIFYDIDGNSSLQYSYANQYIVSLNYMEDTEYSAKEYASNYMANMQNSSEVENVTGATVTIGEENQYTAYQVYMYYPADRTFLVTYWFEAEDGKTHYIALEGGEEITNYLFIPQSFRLTK